ncbi:MAG: hypothetical protein EOP11_21895 [Proteobacteria bacterium]|nr:MAG: hypothetical protein EOP11_21895 [Pseudomonadota bacterium]
MKYFTAVILSLAFTSSLAQASPARPVVKHSIEVAEGAAEYDVEVQDGEVFRAVYPYVEKAEPRLVVREESLLYQGACELMEVKNEAPQVEVYFKMPSTIADSGFNGCRVAIDRGFASDDSDLLNLNYGYTIWD